MSTACTDDGPVQQTLAASVLFVAFCVLSFTAQPRLAPALKASKSRILLKCAALEPCGHALGEGGTCWGGGVGGA